MTGMTSIQAGGTYQGIQVHPPNITTPWNPRPPAQQETEEQSSLMKAFADQAEKMRGPQQNSMECEYNPIAYFDLLFKAKMVEVGKIKVSGTEYRELHGQVGGIERQNYIWDMIQVVPDEESDFKGLRELEETVKL